jgi:hypothetical protein
MGFLASICVEALSLLHGFGVLTPSWYALLALICVLS